MTTFVGEPGTYRTKAGELIHCRIGPDGAVIVEHESRESREHERGKLGGFSIELVKLSDDPNWPDVTERSADLELFAD